MSVMFAVMLGLVMVVASSVSTMGSFYLLPSPVFAADEGGSNGGGGNDDSGSGDNSNRGSNDNGDSVKNEGKTENENTPPPNEGSGDRTTPAATSEQPGGTSKLPKCDGSFQDCVTTNGDVCKAGQGGHECECAEDMSDCPQLPSLQKTSAAGGPDKDCLFHPELPKCKSDNGKCPDGFFQNEDGNCFPQHDKCPKGYHSHENDETGRCIPDSTPCEPGFIRDPDFPTCSNKESVCKKHPDAKGCKNDDGKPIPCNRHVILGSGGHDNRCHYPGPPFHPCGFHGFQFINGKCIKNIFINVHTRTSGGSSGSNNLSDECYDAIKIAWLGKVQRGDSHEVDDFIDNCLDIK